MHKVLLPIGLLLFVMLMIHACLPVARSGSEPGPKISPHIEKRTAERTTWVEPITGMVFVWIPGGSYVMGQSHLEKRMLLEAVGLATYQQWYADESPSHTVSLDDFWIGRTEVTLAQFQRFVQDADYKTDAEKQGFSMMWKGGWLLRPGYTWRQIASTLDHRHPVANVSWNDAKAMAKWLSIKHRRFFRLPTETEWEYACRAGTGSTRFWGDSSAKACQYANLADVSSSTRFSTMAGHDCDDGYIASSPVGAFLPNGFGLYDMLGNVWEWCEDWYGEDYYKSSPKQSPPGPLTGKYRIMRGGFWLSKPGDARSANRSREVPHGRSDTYGFRLVMVSGVVGCDH